MSWFLSLHLILLQKVGPNPASAFGVEGGPMGQDPQQGPWSQKAWVDLGLYVPRSFICEVWLLRPTGLVLTRH